MTALPSILLSSKPSHGRATSIFFVSNAGILKHHPAADHTDADWGAVIDVNLNGVFTACRAAGKHMLGLGSGKIINTASLLTFFGGIAVPGYAASKGAVGQLTKAFSNEWASKGGNINAIAPRLQAHR